MTNEQRVRDLCRQIRGIATNYPAGFELVAREVDGLRWGQANSAELAARLRAQPNDAHTPTSDPSTQVRRKPGRPKKQRTGEQ